MALGGVALRAWIVIGASLCHGLSAPRAASFERWLESSGVESSAVRIEPVEGFGLGLVAQRPIEPMQIVVSVPQEACLTLAKARESPVMRDLPDDLVEMLGDSAVGVALAAELAAGDASPIAPWAARLPSCEDLPLLWPPTLLDGLLAGLDLHDKLRSMREEIDWEFDEVSAALGSATPFGREEYRRASALLLSRAYSLGGDLVLPPLIDFANHCDALPFAVDRGDGVFTDAASVNLVAARAYDAGEQVFSSYGQEHSDGDLLQCFGFVRSGGGHGMRAGSVAIAVGIDGGGGLPPAHAALAEKVAASRGLRLDGEAFRVSVGEGPGGRPVVRDPPGDEEYGAQQSHGAAAALVAFLRLCALDAEGAADAFANAEVCAGTGFGRPRVLCGGEDVWDALQRGLSAANDEAAAAIGVAAVGRALERAAPRPAPPEATAAQVQAAAVARDEELRRLEALRGWFEGGMILDAAAGAGAEYL